MQSNRLKLIKRRHLSSLIQIRQQDQRSRKSYEKAKGRNGCNGMKHAFLCSEQHHQHLPTRSQEVPTTDHRSSRGNQCGFKLGRSRSISLRDNLFSNLFIMQTTLYRSLFLYWSPVPSDVVESATVDGFQLGYVCKFST